MSIFFTADLHFGHKNILKFQRHTRIGSTVDEMDEIIVSNWNSQVCDDDTVYLLGDVSFRKDAETEHLVRMLNGKIHLIKGNHDNIVHKYLYKSVSEYKELKIDKKHVVLFHYPIVRWNRMHYGSYHLFGHSHGSYEHAGRAMDIGLDSRNDMRLWSWEEIDSILVNKPIRGNH